MGIDINNFYLGTPMDRFEYMKMPLSIFPEHISHQYNLEQNAKKGFVYLETWKAYMVSQQREDLQTCNYKKN